MKKEAPRATPAHQVQPDKRPAKPRAQQDAENRTATKMAEWYPEGRIFPRNERANPHEPV